MSCKAGLACCSSTPGYTGDEMAGLANDLRELGQPVVAGFSTHPHWDHVLWHARLGEAPRYGTARCAAAIRDLLSDADWKARVAEGLPPEIAEEIPLDLFGLITGLPAETAQIPWDGPKSGSSSIRRMLGPCGAVDRGTQGSRRRRHAF